MSYIPDFITRKLLPKSLLSRFMMIIIIPTLIGQLLAVYLFYQRHWYNVSNQISGFISTEISSLLHVVDYKKNPNEKHRYLNFDYIFIPNSIIDDTKIKHVKEIEMFKRALRDELGQEGVVIIDDEGDISFYLQIGSDILRVMLRYKALVNPTTYVFVLWLIFLTIFLLSVSLIFSKNQIKSIIELTDAAEKYGNGDKEYSYKPSGAAEIRRAGLSFLKMKERIERQAAKRTKMLAMISHDLKTPLTRMKLQVELMEESEEKEELSHDIDTMQIMINSYLDFARGEGGEVFKVINLRNYLTKYLDSNWSNCNIIQSLGKGNIDTKIKPHSFERALSNLISNALKYSTKVKISLSSIEDEAIIEIEDNGHGISKEKKSLVFKPFYRDDESRTLDNSSSVGLGLAITKEIIAGHNGSILLEDGSELKGLKAIIKIPLT